jgi:hypothetical protein
MKRFLIVTMCTAALVVPAVPVAAAVPAVPVAAAVKALPRAALTGFACQKAMEPPDRSVAVKAVMRPVTGTRSLSLKFELTEQSSNASRTLNGAGDLGVWLAPKDPTLGRRSGDVWELTKSVSNLDAPASYRFRVTFRWLGAHGKVLSTAVRQTVSCAQRELRPDLLVRGVTVTAIPHHPHKQRYTAVITDRGATGAGPFDVLFTPGDPSAPQTKTVTHIAARSSLRVSFVGPVCSAASPPTVVADSSNQVDDYNRDNNALTVTCPA